MKYRIRHETQYLYSEPVNLSQNQVRLTPLHIDTQYCYSTELSIFPRPSYRSTFLDANNNLVTHFDVTHQHQELRVIAEHVVEVLDKPQLDLHLPTMSWESVRDAIHNPQNAEGLAILLHAKQTAYTRFNEQISAFCREVFEPNKDLLSVCQVLMTRIFEEIEFDSAASSVATTAIDTIKKRKGVCQDFTHLALACLRSVGLAAQYISGYIETVPPEGEEKLVGADATHAWFAVFVPSIGWVEFDPTNNIIPEYQHVKLAVGRDYHDVAPIKGMLFGGGHHHLNVAVDMNRFSEEL